MSHKGIDNIFNIAYNTTREVIRRLFQLEDEPYTYYGDIVDLLERAACEILDSQTYWRERAGYTPPDQHLKTSP